MKQQIAIVVGHEPGGGAAGERSYNLAMSVIMRDYLEGEGYDVYIHHHRAKGYSQRMRDMRAAINDQQPDCAACMELHFNSYSNDAAQGHEFFYRGAKAFAESVRDEFQEAFPWSSPRRNNGIDKVTSGNGAGFLKESPAWACLVEPFFESNAKEKEFFMSHQTALAECYCRGIIRFLTNQH